MIRSWALRALFGDRQARSYAACVLTLTDARGSDLGKGCGFDAFDEMGLDMDSSDCPDDLDILCFLCLSLFLFRTALFSLPFSGTC